MAEGTYPQSEAPVPAATSLLDQLATLLYSARGRPKERDAETALRELHARLDHDQLIVDGVPV
eukprot:5123325-Prorocentrum_lima.AAC.1